MINPEFAVYHALPKYNALLFTHDNWYVNGTVTKFNVATHNAPPADALSNHIDAGPLNVPTVDDIDEH